MQVPCASNLWSSVPHSCPRSCKERRFHVIRVIDQITESTQTDFPDFSRSAGWDNDKISILYENLQSMKPDDDYSDIIIRPAVRKVVPSEAELQAEEKQTFLGRLVQQLQLQQPPTVGIAGAVNGATTSPTPAVAGVSSPAAGTPIRGVPEQKLVDRRASFIIPSQVDYALFAIG